MSNLNTASRCHTFLEENTEVAKNPLILGVFKSPIELEANVTGEPYSVCDLKSYTGFDAATAIAYLTAKTVSKCTLSTRASERLSCTNSLSRKPLTQGVSADKR